MSASATHNERLIAVIATYLEGVRHVAVGASSPIPAAAAMLVRARAAAANAPEVKLSILGSVKHNFFTNGSAELFDCAAQGRIDAFFLGGGQIDGHGNINLVGVGEYPNTKVRWPGSFGSAYLYFQVPRVILFREEHTPRVLVDQVDFISAPGTSAPDVVRSGGPVALVTGRAVFDFDKERAGFTLKSWHPGEDADTIRAQTGFTYETDATAATTADPDAATLELLRGRVADELSETYPKFAARLRDEIATPDGPKA